MIIGVPKEIHRHEHRVGLTPFAVVQLIRAGHNVVVERGAGQAAHFSEQRYEEAGAQIVFSSEEVYKRADLVCRVGSFSKEELELLKPESAVCAFHHLAVAPRENVDRLMSLKTTLIGYEIIQDDEGDLPILVPFSEMAGQMGVYVAAQYLQIEAGGRGILVGNVPGVPPPTVLVLGGGTVGRAATRQALACGAHVVVLDEDMTILRDLHHEFGGQTVTVLGGLDRLERHTAIADIVVGAVHKPGSPAPMMVTEDMVKTMKPGSVIVDLAIDQGGCVETSRPTTLANPTYVVHDVVHYCVPNMTANVARTASRALANAAIPYLLDLAKNGLSAALRRNAGLAAGAILYRGTMVNDRIAKSLGIGVSSLQRLLQES
jgi:alanine dehydrogenase